MTDDQPIYEPGDVVFGDDPFKGEVAARPWLVVTNHEGRPFHGDQYVALTLTTRSWLDGLVEIPDEAWVRGGTPEPSRVVPWGVQSLDADDVDRWQGTVESWVVTDAVDELVEKLRYR